MGTPTVKRATVNRLVPKATDLLEARQAYHLTVMRMVMSHQGIIDVVKVHTAVHTLSVTSALQCLYYLLSVWPLSVVWR